MKNLLLKIQKFPDRQRKIIFWVIMIILALVLSVFYIKNAQKRTVDINAERTKEELHLPFLEEEFRKLPSIEFPKIEMPEINQGTLQELERIMEETSTEATNCQPCQPIE